MIESELSASVDLYNAGVGHARRGELKDAERLLREAVAVEPGLAVAQSNLGKVGLLLCALSLPHSLTHRAATHSRPIHPPRLS